jgi:hypothetical protein
LVMRLLRRLRMESWEEQIGPMGLEHSGQT